MTIINWTLIGLYSLFMLCVVDDTIRDVSNGIISKRKAFVYLFFVVSITALFFNLAFNLMY